MFQIDMNSVRDDEVGSLLSHADDPLRAQMFRPSVGDSVVAVDEEGNQCIAVVAETAGDWLRLKLDWDLWMPKLPIKVGQPSFTLGASPHTLDYVASKNLSVQDVSASLA